MHTTTQTPENRLEREGQPAKAGLSKGTLLASIVAGITASICCLDPRLLLTLGVSGSWIGSLSALRHARQSAPSAGHLLGGHRRRVGDHGLPLVWPLAARLIPSLRVGFTALWVVNNFVALNNCRSGPLDRDGFPTLGIAAQGSAPTPPSLSIKVGS